MLAKQVAKKVWKKLNEARKLAKSDTQSVLTALQEKYHVAFEDKTDGAVRLQPVLGVVLRNLDTLSSFGDIVFDALHGYSLNTITLYAGDSIKEGCYEGAMADYEQDECRMYVAAGRATDTSIDASLTLGAHNVGKDFRTVFAHEIGHLVMPFFEEAVGEKFAITFDSQPVVFWKKRVSEYAGTDDHELFGEAFAAWTHPDYGKDGQVLPAVLEALFTKAGIKSAEMTKLEKASRQTAVDITTADGVLWSATAINDILDVVNDADWFEIEGTISPALMQAFKDAGYQELVTAGSSTDAVMVDNVSKGAAEYAETHSADLVTGLTDTTRNKLRGTIEDAVQEGWSQDELAEEIANNFAFGEVRAELIARNELGLAYSKGRQTAAEDAGATKKRSLLSADHDDKLDCGCEEAADAGEVDFEDTFIDDDDYDFPPYHMNCECDWIGVYGSEDADGSDDEDESDDGEDEEHGKFLKSTAHPPSVQVIDEADTPYIQAALSEEDDAANDAVQALSAKALLLATPDDINGQRISGKANKFTLEACTNYGPANSRAADHRQAYELHAEACKHYETDFINPEAAVAHMNAAMAHKEIYDRLVQIGKRAIDNDAHVAATSPLNDTPEPSDAQKEAGNYKKGHINIGGIDISIENPAGSKRRPEWPTLQMHYGYIKLTTGADGEQIDCFVRCGCDDKYNGPVYVIDQVNADGSFDEHKVIIGFNSKQKAVAAYLANYKPGWKLGGVTRLDWVTFKEWVDERTHVEPIKV